MEGDYILANFLKLFFLFTSPVIFVVGIFLLYDVDTILRLEKLLAKSYGVSKGTKKTIASWLEKDRARLHLFLLKRRHILGVVCLLNAGLAVFTTLFLLKGY